MNRLILIGNGFDLAHGLKTSYTDFIDWYWEKCYDRLCSYHSQIWENNLCRFWIKANYPFWSAYFSVHGNSLLLSPKKEIIANWMQDTDTFEIQEKALLYNIHQQQKEKKWVDIENVFYALLKQSLTTEIGQTALPPKELNTQLETLKQLLAQYLKKQDEIAIHNTSDEIRLLFYEPLQADDMAVSGKNAYEDHIKTLMSFNQETWDDLLWQYRISETRRIALSSQFGDFRRQHAVDIQNRTLNLDNFPKELILPEHIMILNFNYTHTAEYYYKSFAEPINYIHGNIEDLDKIIFGYGDELDKEYRQLVDQNDNEYLRHIKSVNYLQSANYRRMLSFINSAPFQIYIMGHSCGNSDRTLLNTLFEHPNCVSIKPFYYQRPDGTDTYIDLVQNIYRNFTDTKLMRDRVVNKTFCQPLPQIEQNTD